MNYRCAVQKEHRRQKKRKEDPSGVSKSGCTSFGIVQIGDPIGYCKLQSAMETLEHIGH